MYEATINNSEGRQAMKPFLDAYLVDPEVQPERLGILTFSAALLGFVFCVLCFVLWQLPVTSKRELVLFNNLNRKAR